MISGIALVIFAAILQGVFLLPMSRARNWAWEHTWLAFSLAGMIIFNWSVSFVMLRASPAILTALPLHSAFILACFGVAWGIGALLFGWAMDALGLALGYPLIMGLNASVGTFIPLLWLYGREMFTGRRLFIVAGMALAIVGIALCSKAGAKRASAGHNTPNTSRVRFLRGLLSAIVSGCLSCLPNLGLLYGSHAIQASLPSISSSASANNAIWVIFFTFGGLINIGYCAWMIVHHKSSHLLFRRDCRINWLWALAMGAMWICSFYLYGAAVARAGSSGATIGWPILISLSIAVGVLCGVGLAGC
jgi:L-rhamnose-H+ transport protein